jgi:hypothetical protein
MPLPAARFTLSYVGGGARAQGSGAAARAEAQIDGVLRCGELEHRQVCAGHVQRVQWRNLRGLPQAPAAASLARQAPGGRPGQRQLPPRRVIGAAPAPVAETSCRCCFCHRTVRNSHPSNAFGSSPDGSPPTTGTSRPSPRYSMPSMPASSGGNSPTRCREYYTALLTSLC